MKNILFSIIISLIYTPILSQGALSINPLGQLKTEDYNKIIKQGNYDGISYFDTVSLEPVLIYAMVVKVQKIGLIDNYGKEILKCEYDQIVGIRNSTSPHVQFHDHLIIKKEGKWAVSNLKGTILTSFDYAYISFEKYSVVGERKLSPKNIWGIDICKDSIFKASLDESGRNYIYLNTKGKKVNFTHVDGQNSTGSYWDRIYPVDEELKKNNYNVPKELGIARPQTKQYCIVQSNDKTNRNSGIYDTLQHKWIVPMEFSTVLNARILPYFYVYNRNGVQAYDTTGEIRTKEFYERIEEIGFGDNLAIILTNKVRKKALYSNDFKPLTDFIYDNIENCDDFVLCTFDKTKHLFDLQGRRIDFTVDFDRIHLMTNSFGDQTEGFLNLIKGGKSAIVNQQGKIISGFDYDRIIPEYSISSDNYTLSGSMFMTANHSNRFIFFQKDRKYGLMDNHYKVILKNEYEMMVESMHADFLYLAQRDPKSNEQKWGVYSISKKKLIVPIKYGSHIQISNEFIIVRQDKSFGGIDFNGKIIVPVNHVGRIEISKKYEGLFLIYDEKGLVSIIDQTQKAILPFK